MPVPGQLARDVLAILVLLAVWKLFYLSSNHSRLKAVSLFPKELPLPRTAPTTQNGQAHESRGPKGTPPDVKPSTKASPSSHEPVPEPSLPKESTSFAEEGHDSDELAPDGISGVYSTDIGHVVLHPDSGVDVVRPTMKEWSGLRGVWKAEGNVLTIVWNKHGNPQNHFTRSSGGWSIGRGGEIGPLSNRRPMSALQHIYSFGTRMRWDNRSSSRPYFLYMGKCCDSHWEQTYIPQCRDGPGCSSQPSIVYDTSNNDLYHPSIQCDVPCVVHHDPLMPIDVVLTGGFVSREDYYADINRKREVKGAELISPNNRPIAASLCLEPFWRTKRRTTNAEEMKMVDMIMSTHLNADIPLTRFSLLRLETDKYEWNTGKNWVHWSKYAQYEDNKPPTFSSFDQEHLLSVVIAHCDGSGDYPKGYGNRMNYINALIDSGLSVYLTGRLNRCRMSHPKKKFWASDKRELIRKYKFHLAVENCDEKDWVTEKLYQTIMAGVVPVYVGSPNVFEFVPRSMMIVAADYKSPKELTDYLTYLGSNETAYEEYRSWRSHARSHPVSKHLDWTFNHSTANAYCLVCQKLRENQKRKDALGMTSWGKYWQREVRKGQTWILSPDKGWTWNGKGIPRTENPPTNDSII